MTPAEQAVLHVCGQMRWHRSVMAKTLAEKDDALRVLWAEAGVPKAQMHTVVRALLVSAGWEAADIDLVGVGDASVKEALGTRRRVLDDNQTVG